MKSYTAKDVAELMRSAKEAKNPYVFFTGAGCSITAGVPSANSLVAEIKRKFPVQTKYVDTADINQYGSYMSALDKNERRQLLSPYIIDNKKINWAHIALACLIKEGFITRVLTFNFDSILSRACNLIGLYPSIYDFATASPHLYHLINDPSIVHLHGQGAGFIQLNTEQETKDHAQKMSDFVAAILNSNPSLFIGYSGNADAFFPLLEEKYSEQHRLIWTGRKKSIDELEAQAVKGFLTKNQNITHYIGEVDADQFLIQIAQHLECFPPEVIDNPAQHTLDLFKDLTDFPVDDEEYPFDILALKRRILSEESEQTKTTNEDNIRGRLIRGKCSISDIYNKFINGEEDAELLDVDDKEVVAWVYMVKAVGFMRRGKKEWKECLFKKSFEMFDHSLKIYPDNSITLSNYGLALFEFSKLEESEGVFLQSIERSEKSVILQPNHPNILCNYALILSNYAKFKKDEALFDKSIEIYERVLGLDSDNINFLNSYGLALYKYAKIKQDTSLFIKSIDKYEKMLIMNSDNSSFLHNYTSVLLGYAS